jgi:hypothetical protein
VQRAKLSEPLGFFTEFQKTINRGNIRSVQEQPSGPRAHPFIEQHDIGSVAMSSLQSFERDRVRLKC